MLIKVQSFACRCLGLREMDEVGERRLIHVVFEVAY
jgi:hypothetical protein